VERDKTSYIKETEVNRMTITEIGNELVNIAETLARVISELTALADSVTKLNNALKVDAVDKPAPKAPQKQTPALAEVRALLTEVSRSGKTAEVKKLLESHGCSKLSEVKDELYEELMKEARALL